MALRACESERAAVQFRLPTEASPPVDIAWRFLSVRTRPTKCIFRHLAGIRQGIPTIPRLQPDEARTPRQVDPFAP